MCLGLKIFDDDHKNRTAYSTKYKEEEVLEVNFQVVSKRTGLTYDVYAVKETSFLIFFNGDFCWKPMSQFRPTKKTEQERNQGDTRPMFKSQQKEMVMFP